MSITVLKIMEEVGSRQTKRICSYINDGLSEIAGLIPDKVERSTIDIVSGTRFYGLPSTMKNLLGVFQMLDSDENEYERIGIIQSVDVIQDSSASSTTSDDDIVVI